MNTRRAAMQRRGCGGRQSEFQCQRRHGGIAQERDSRQRLDDPRSLSADTSARLNAIPRCSPPEQSVLADLSVWLECSGELMDVQSVDVLRTREATAGIELIEFACPRCRTPHASLRFG
jgi:hypothetical protein